MPDNNNTIKYRLEQVEKKAIHIDGKLDVIMENHLPHIHQDIIKVENKVDRNSTKMAIYTAINVGSIIVGLLLTRFFK